MSLDLVRLNDLPLDDLQPLLHESQSEGFEFVGRLLDDYVNHRNRFAALGETLLGIYDGQQLIAIGGLNRDPYQPDGDTGRVRHVYVLTAYRRQGVGQLLMKEIITVARQEFSRVTLRTMTAPAARFYEALGFQPTTTIDGATHVLDLLSPFYLNRVAWDSAVAGGQNPYATAVSAATIAEARAGRWSLLLSDIRPVPGDWFPPLAGSDVLCLASGGGQQAPIFAALGARVTLLDASPAQLALDRFVAQRDHLAITLLEGDMADLSRLADESFDLIFNPPSTLFVPHLQPIWQECYRVLRPQGILMTGFMNPDEFVFDHVALDEEEAFVVKYSLPYVEHETLSQAELAARIARQEMFHFSHSMETQIGGLLRAGFVMTDFYEDRRPESDGNPIRHVMPSYYVARLRKERSHGDTGSNPS